jgi:hypothetical protein
VSGDSVVYEGLDETGTARAGQALRAVPVAIEVSHLTKVFGGRTAVSDISFGVAGGEVFDPGAERGGQARYWVVTSISEAGLAGDRP